MDNQLATGSKVQVVVLSLLHEPWLEKSILHFIMCMKDSIIQCVGYASIVDSLRQLYCDQKLSIIHSVL